MADIYRYGDIEITIDYYGDELTAVIEKDGKLYDYPADEISGLLDNLIPGWYSVYAQEEEISEEELAGWPEDEDDEW